MVGLRPLKALPWDLSPGANRHLLMPEMQNPLSVSREGAAAVFGRLAGVASLRSP